MKYCRECKVNVNKKHTNCPLCGAYLSEEGRGNLRYEREIENSVSNYEMEYRDIVNRNFMKKKSFSLCLFLIAVCFLINFLTSRESLWSLYVAIGVLVLYFSVISSIFRRKRFYSILSNCILFLPISIVLIDLVLSFDTVRSISAFGFSVKFVAPAILLAGIILSDVMIANRITKCTYYTLTLLEASVLALVPQTAIWLFMMGTDDTWFAFSVFAFSIIHLFIVFTIKWRWVVEEIRKKFSTR